MDRPVLFISIFSGKLVSLPACIKSMNGVNQNWLRCMLVLLFHNIPVLAPVLQKENEVSLFKSAFPKEIHIHCRDMSGILLQHVSQNHI